MKFRHFIVAIFSVLLLSILLISNEVVAADDNEKVDKEENMVQLEKLGEMNHMEIIENIRNYIHENIEDGVFASLYIDREENESGDIVLSFTKELTEEVKREIRALAEDHIEVRFRVVPYTEKELVEKQMDIDHALFEEKVFEDKGIQVYHTSANIITNKVEIGISPFNEENAKIVRDYFNDEMVDVVEGHEVHLLADDIASVQEDDPSNTDSTLPLIENDSKGESTSIFVKIINWLKSLLNFF